MTENGYIKGFIEARDRYDEAEIAMKHHFLSKLELMLDNAKVPQDFIEMREMLRPMPECASKVLLFRRIILEEKEFNSKHIH